MKILFIGDVYGDLGKEILKKNLPYLKEKYNYNLLIVNGENASKYGRGLNYKSYKEFMEMKVNLVTLGNHAFSQNDIYDFIDNSNVIRPANFYNVNGKGYHIINFNGKKVLVINIMGRTMINFPLDCPFRTVDEILKKEKYDYAIVDFHAEATSEKIAMGWYLDGKVNAVLGTHTHVQTADLRILPNKTIYITDVGMTGPKDGVIGVNKEIIINRFINGMSKQNFPEQGLGQLNGVILDFTDKFNPKAERISIIEE